MGLRDQHTIERIFVDRGQIQSRYGMFGRDRKFMPAIVDQGAPQSVRRDSEIFAAQPMLDRHLPKACSAEP